MVNVTAILEEGGVSPDFREALDRVAAKVEVVSNPSKEAPQEAEVVTEYDHERLNRELHMRALAPFKRSANVDVRPVFSEADPAAQSIRLQSEKSLTADEANKLAGHMMDLYR